MPHKGTHHRGYLPHRDHPDVTQAITFRLADSVPSKLISNWRNDLAELLSSPDEEEAKEAAIQLHHRITRYEDAGHGSCLLRIPEIAEVAQATLIAQHGQRYTLIEWCIMPNHVHVMIGIDNTVSLSKIIQTWKGSSARQINQRLGRSGKLWSPDYHDRYIRDEKHFANAIRYIHQNPVKAGLCRQPEDWPHSSIGSHWDRGL